MTTLGVSAPNPTDAPPPIMLEPRHWLAALAMIFVLFAPYQTLVQTVITDDAIRLGVEAEYLGELLDDHVEDQIAQFVVVLGRRGTVPPRLVADATGPRRTGLPAALTPFEDA